ncbi:putative D-ala-D-ala carboxypeptidase [uncultured Caudovirales phage]|uniref:Putative D-ala-D-ala carboxypeptidase n=1 Tax=uncultured Caudovirales phage TaxID=2100421 RepID=A0A2H4JAN9_9CAUD|nr:putative D-ala-D-ala carboxypeptidase [uncultured Caudovirales phage]
MSIALYYLKYGEGKSKSSKQTEVEKEAKNLESTFQKNVSDELFLMIENLMKELKIPSIQVSIYTKEKGYFNCTSGYSNTENKTKANNNNVYHLASITKIYTQAVILKLLQDKVLNLDDSVSKYIDISPNGDKVTIKDLLFYTSGLHDPIKSVYKMLYFGKKWDYEKILSEIKRNKPYFEAGARREYSSVGHILLGIIAENVTNKPFKILLNELFLEKYGLDSTFYPFQEELPIGTLATGYDKDFYQLGKVNMTANVDKFPINLQTIGLSSGGMVSNAKDVAKFLFNLYETDILNNDSKRKFRLILSTKKYNEVNIRMHEGHIAGYNNFCGYSDTRKFSVSILTNLSNVNKGNDLNKLVTEIIGILRENEII